MGPPGPGSHMEMVLGQSNLTGGGEAIMRSLQSNNLQRTLTGERNGSTASILLTVFLSLSLASASSVALRVFAPRGETSPPLSPRTFAQPWLHRRRRRTRQTSFKRRRSSGRSPTSHAWHAWPRPLNEVYGKPGQEMTRGKGAESARGVGMWTDLEAIVVGRFLYVS